MSPPPPHSELYDDEEELYDEDESSSEPEWPDAAMRVGSESSEESRPRPDALCLENRASVHLYLVALYGRQAARRTQGTLDSDLAASGASGASGSVLLSPLDCAVEDSLDLSCTLENSDADRGEATDSRASTQRLSPGLESASPCGRRQPNKLLIGLGLEDGKFSNTQSSGEGAEELTLISPLAGTVTTSQDGLEGTGRGIRSESSEKEVASLEGSIQLPGATDPQSKAESKASPKLMDESERSQVTGIEPPAPETGGYAERAESEESIELPSVGKFALDLESEASRRGSRLVPDKCESEHASDGNLTQRNLHVEQTQPVICETCPASQRDAEGHALAPPLLKGKASATNSRKGVALKDVRKVESASSPGKRQVGRRVPMKSTAECSSAPTAPAAAAPPHRPRSPVKPMSPKLPAMPPELRPVPPKEARAQNARPQRPIRTKNQAQRETPEKDGSDGRDGAAAASVCVVSDVMTIPLNAEAVGEPEATDRPKSSMDSSGRRPGSSASGSRPRRRPTSARREAPVDKPNQVFFLPLDGASVWRSAKNHADNYVIPDHAEANLQDFLGRSLAFFEKEQKAVSLEQSPEGQDAHGHPSGHSPSGHSPFAGEVRLAGSAGSALRAARSRR